MGEIHYFSNQVQIKWCLDSWLLILPSWFWHFSNFDIEDPIFSQYFSPYLEAILWHFLLFFEASATKMSRYIMLYVRSLKKGESICVQLINDCRVREMIKDYVCISAFLSISWLSKVNVEINETNKSLYLSVEALQSTEVLTGDIVDLWNKY